MRARTAVAAATWAVAAAAALGLKAFYSTANAEQLRFMLAPTTALVEAAGGYSFDWTSGGYLSGELHYMIAPVCAGVNFLIVAYCALVLGLVRPRRSPWQNVGLLFGSAAAAYLTALAANALRILVAIPLWTHRVGFGALTPERLHELVGVAVFLSMLLLVWALARRLSGAALGAWMPMVPYLGVMVVVPLLRGGHLRSGFWPHVGSIAAVSAAAGAIALLVQRTRWTPSGQSMKSNLSRASRAGATASGPMASRAP